MNPDARGSFADARPSPPTVSRPVLACLAALLLAGCLPAPASVPDPLSEPAFRPEVFFAGRSHGEPVVAIRTKGRQTLRVESVGAATLDGAFRLDQTITYPDGHADRRTWTMRALGGGRYAATLTPDATGPVEAEAVGNTFRIRYPMRGGLRMEQTLVLRPGGQVADNVATVRWGGMPIARITEAIAREGASDR